MKTRVLMAVALTAAVCASAVWSQGGPGPGRRERPGGPPAISTVMATMPPPPGIFDRLADILQLTDDQAAKLNEAAAKNDKSIRSLAQKAAEAVRAVHEAVLAPSYDAQKVKDLAATAQRAEAEVVTASIEAWTQIRSILTEDQAVALKDVMSAPRPGPGQAPPGPPPGEAGAPPPPPPPQ